MTGLAQRAERILELQATFQACKCTVHDRYGPDGDGHGRCAHELAFDNASDEAADLIRELVAENERLTEAAKLANDGWHMANGVADLAMKHRDAAEKQLAAAIMKAHAEATDEFAAVDVGPTPLRGRVTRRDE